MKKFFKKNKKHHLWPIFGHFTLRPFYPFLSKTEKSCLSQRCITLPTFKKYQREDSKQHWFQANARTDKHEFIGSFRPKPGFKKNLRSAHYDIFEPHLYYHSLVWT